MTSIFKPTFPDQKPRTFAAIFPTKTPYGIRSLLNLVGIFPHFLPCSLFHLRSSPYPLLFFCPRLFRSRSISHGFRNQIGISVCRREPSDGGGREQGYKWCQNIYSFISVFFCFQNGDRRKITRKTGKTTQPKIGRRTTHTDLSLRPN